MKSITYQEYVNKTHGCWLGKSIGGTIGAPYENHKFFDSINEDNAWPSIIYPNDDLDIQVVWLELLEEVGPYFKPMDMEKIWRERCWYNFAEYGFFLYNAQRGIHSPLSGEFDNVFFCECEGCPIRAEIWGAVAPGHPGLACKMAKWDGQLDHIDFSVWAEQFWAASVAAAYTAETLEEALEAGRSAVPKGSLVDLLCDEVPAIWEQCEHDLHRTWREMIYRYGHRDGSKGEINFCFSLLPLLICGGDFKQTVITAVNLGWDTDCTAATAGALLGTFLGVDKLPKDWAELMGPNLACDCNVRHKTAPLTQFAEDTCMVGLEMLAVHGDRDVITDVPADIEKTVKDRLAARKMPHPVEIDVTYRGEPTLKKDDVTAMDLHVAYSGHGVQKATLTLQSVRGDLDISPAQTELLLYPGEVIDLTVFASLKKDQKILWDKNLITATVKGEGMVDVQHEFGLAGGRQWMIYGPYFDEWDKETDGDICPFRNDKVVANPHAVGAGKAGSHTFVPHYREYLDEAALIKSEIPQEYPHLIQDGKDYLENDTIMGYTGEAVFYLTREIVADTDIECVMNIGATGPFTLWIDGEEVLKSETHQGWLMQDFPFTVKMSDKPKRVVMKCVRDGDHYQASLVFIKTDVPGDKMTGDSFLVDRMGEVIR